MNLFDVTQSYFEDPEKDKKKKKPKKRPFDLADPRPKQPKPYGWMEDPERPRDPYSVPGSPERESSFTEDPVDQVKTERAKIEAPSEQVIPNSPGVVAAKDYDYQVGEQQSKLRDLKDFENNPVVNENPGFKGRVADSLRVSLTQGTQGYLQAIKAGMDPRQALGYMLGSLAGGAIAGAIRPEIPEEYARQQQIGQTENKIAELQNQQAGIQKQVRLGQDSRMRDLNIASKIQSVRSNDPDIKAALADKVVTREESKALAKKGKYLPAQDARTKERINRNGRVLERPTTGPGKFTVIPELGIEKSKEANKWKIDGKEYYLTDKQGLDLKRAYENRDLKKAEAIKKSIIKGQNTDIKADNRTAEANDKKRERKAGLIAEAKQLERDAKTLENKGTSRAKREAKAKRSAAAAKRDKANAIKFRGKSKRTRTLRDPLGVRK